MVTASLDEPRERLRIAVRFPSLLSRVERALAVARVFRTVESTL